MTRKTLTTLFAFTLLLAAPALFAATPAADAPVVAELDAPSCDGAAVLDADGDSDADRELLEELLSISPSDPSNRSEDSGICCNSSSQCPTISGYAKRCSSGSCTSAWTCLYRKL